MFDDIQPVIGPYADPPLACREADTRATEVALQVCGIISSHLRSVRAEHVGSTAVPGCAGRGIIDLLVSGPNIELAAACHLLTRLGFQQGDVALFPPHDPEFWGSWTQDGELFLIHVHILPADSPESDSMRFFRSCLRADAELMRAYVAQKRAIVASGADAAEYRRQKGEFLKMVLG